MSQLAVYSGLFLMMILCANSAPAPTKRSTDEPITRNEKKFYDIAIDLLGHINQMIKNVSAWLFQILLSCGKDCNIGHATTQVI